MKFLLDMPVSLRTAAWLRSRGFDAVHARERGLARAQDIDLLSLAAGEQRFLLTMDLDFPAILSATQAGGPTVLLIRMRNPRPSLVQNQLELLLRTYSESQLASCIVTIEDTRFRLRKLPL